MTQDKKYSGKELGFVIVLLFTMFTIGAVTMQLAPTDDMDEEHFESIINDATLETLERANDSFQEEDTVTGIHHTKSAATMVWANIQVTESDHYSELWQRLNFDCIAEEHDQFCITTVTTAHEYIENELPHNREINESEENVSSNGEPRLDDTVSFAADVNSE